MKELWDMVQMIFATVGGRLGYFLSCCDGMVCALVTFVVIDYIAGGDVHDCRQEAEF